MIKFKEKLMRYCFKPVDTSSLVLFRIGFGIIQIWWICSGLLQDKIYVSYLQPLYIPPMPGFDWLPIFQGHGLYIIFFLMFIGALGITLGWQYRLNAILFFVTRLYVFQLDYTTYNNHYYLVCLYAGCLIFMDAHKSFSLDNYFSKVRQDNTVPFWNLGLIRIQVMIVYLYGGIAKLFQVGWWKNPYQLSEMLVPFAGHRVLGYLFNSYVIYFLAWSGMLFDLGIGGLVLFKKTRKLGIFLMIGFHVFNHLILFSPYTGRAGIGIFPLLGIILALMFLEPSQPRVCLAKISAWANNLANQSKNEGVEEPAISIKSLINWAITIAIVGIMFYFPIKSWVTHTPQPFTWTDTLRVPE